MASAQKTLTQADVWRAIGKARNAVLGHVTGSGAPRTSAVVFRAIERRLYVAVKPGTWKARHLAAEPRVAMTILVHRGGILPLIFPIPPAVINLHGTAVVHHPGAPEMAPYVERLGPLLPRDAGTMSIIEITPEGDFLTYGIGVPLSTMRVSSDAQARIPAR